MRLTNYLALDFEWEIQTGAIYCAGFMDDVGNGKALHVSQFENEAGLLKAIIKKINQYDTSIGYYSLGENSDLITLHNRCVHNGIPSPVNTEKLEIEAITDKIHLDIHKVFDKLVVKNYIYKKKYKDMMLDSVANALLGKGKIGTGKHSQELNDEGKYDEVMKYCLWDANLTMELSKVGQLDKKTKMPKLDGGLMDLMFALADKTGLQIQTVCHFGMSSIWRKILKDEGTAPTNPIFRPRKGEKRKGPYIMEPTTGSYTNIAVLDVASLYPAIVANHNISPDSMCCQCCGPENNPNACTSAHTGETLWTCKRRQGICSVKTRDMRTERMAFKNKGDKVMADGLKIVMNAETGLFNNCYFEYADFRCYDAIIGWERKYIAQIIEFATSLGMKVIYSDTDSIFVKYDSAEQIKATIEEMAKHGIELEHEKTYEKLLLTSKKHYIGKTDEGETVIAGMEGEKNDRPKWINEAFADFANNYVRNGDIIYQLKRFLKFFQDGDCPIDKLSYSIKITKNPEDYDKEAISKQVGYLAHAKAGDVVHYWKTKDGPVVEPPKFEELDKGEYEKTFESTFEDALKLLGHDIAEVMQGQISLAQFWGK